MKRKELIRYINSTYPADSKEDDTRAIGVTLLTEVLNEEGIKSLISFLSDNWKLLPDSILQSYYKKCGEMNEGD